MLCSQRFGTVAEQEHFIWGEGGRSLWQGGKWKQEGGQQLQIKESKISISKCFIIFIIIINIKPAAILDDVLLLVLKKLVLTNSLKIFVLILTQKLEWQVDGQSFLQEGQMPAPQQLRPWSGGTSCFFSLFFCVMVRECIPSPNETLGFSGSLALQFEENPIRHLRFILTFFFFLLDKAALTCETRGMCYYECQNQSVVTIGRDVFTFLLHKRRSFLIPPELCSSSL